MKNEYFLPEKNFASEKYAETGILTPSTGQSILPTPTEEQLSEDEEEQVVNE